MRALVAIALVACGPSVPRVTVPAPYMPEAVVETPTPPVVPADPPPHTDGRFTEAWVNGLHVLVKRNPGAPTVSTHLVIRGGVRNWTAADAGIEELALRASVAGGSETLSRDALALRLSDLGGELAAGAGQDYASLTAWSLAPAWADVFAVLVDVYRHPALQADRVEVARQRQLHALRVEEDDPDDRLYFRLYREVFAGHPYANRAYGTPATVAALTVPQLRAHLDRLRETSRLFLVVVGDIDPATVIAAVERGFGDLPRGAYVETPLPPWKPERGVVTIADDKLPTNYVAATTLGPAWGDPDFFAIWVGMLALHDRYFYEIRTKRNLSYEPDAYFRRATGIPLVGIYVTAVDAKATLAVMLEHAKLLRDNPLSAEELNGAKGELLTQTYSAAQDPAGQAANLVHAQILGGDWHVLEDLPAKFQAVTAPQIQAWFAAHLTHLHAMVLRGGGELDREALEAF